MDNELKKQARFNKKHQKGRGWWVKLDAGDVPKANEFFNNTTNSNATDSTTATTAVAEDLGIDKNEIFALIKEINPNSKEENYEDMDINKMLAVLANMRKNKDKYKSNITKISADVLDAIPEVADKFTGVKKDWEDGQLYHYQDGEKGELATEEENEPEYYKESLDNDIVQLTLELAGPDNGSNQFDLESELKNNLPIGINFRVDSFYDPNISNYCVVTFNGPRKLLINTLTNDYFGYDVKDLAAELDKQNVDESLNEVKKMNIKEELNKLDWTNLDENFYDFKNSYSACKWSEAENDTLVRLITENKINRIHKLIERKLVEEFKIDEKVDLKEEDIVIPADLSRYYEVVDETNPLFMDMIDSWYAIGDSLPGYDMHVVGYAVAKEPYFDELFNNGLDAAIITDDPNHKLVYNVGNKFFDIKDELPKIIKDRDLEDLKESPEDNEKIEDKVWEIADRYNTSIPVSGKWETETEHELKAIMKELNISREDAIDMMVKILGFEKEDFNESADFAPGYSHDSYDKGYYAEPEAPIDEPIIYGIYYSNTETGDFGDYGIDTDDLNKAIEKAKDLKKENPHCNYYVYHDIDDFDFDTEDMTESLTEGIDTDKPDILDLRYIIDCYVEEFDPKYPEERADLFEDPTIKSYLEDGSLTEDEAQALQDYYDEDCDKMLDDYLYRLEDNKANTDKVDPEKDVDESFGWPEDPRDDALYKVKEYVREMAREDKEAGHFFDRYDFNEFIHVLRDDDFDVTEEEAQKLFDLYFDTFEEYNVDDRYDADHAAEWMDKHPYGWYNSESDYGTGDEEDELPFDESLDEGKKFDKFANDVYDAAKDVFTIEVEGKPVLKLGKKEIAKIEQIAVSTKDKFDAYDKALEFVWSRLSQEDIDYLSKNVDDKKVVDSFSNPIDKIVDRARRKATFNKVKDKVTDLLFEPEEESLNEALSSEEHSDIIKSAEHDLKTLGGDADIFYVIGSELAARDLPWHTSTEFLDDSVGQGDAEYEHMKAGYLENGGVIEESLNKKNLKEDYDTDTFFVTFTGDRYQANSDICEASGKTFDELEQNMRKVIDASDNGYESSELDEDDLKALKKEIENFERNRSSMSEDDLDYYDFDHTVNILWTFPENDNFDDFFESLDKTKKEILYVIKDKQGHQLSAPNKDDNELWDRVEAMEARGQRGLQVVVYTGTDESLNENTIDSKQWLEDAGFEVDSLEDIKSHNVAEDKEIIDYMEKENLNYMLTIPEMARFWYCHTLDGAVNYFKNGGKVGFDNHATILD